MIYYRSIKSLQNLQSLQEYLDFNVSLRMKTNYQLKISSQIFTKPHEMKLYKDQLIIDLTLKLKIIGMQYKTTNKSCSKQRNSIPLERNLTLIRSTLQKAMKQIKQQSSACRALSFIKRISLDLDFDKMQKMLLDLQKGYVVLKHSVNTCQPHNKYVYISGDRRFLCWKSLQKDDEKMIELRKIQNIIQNDVQFMVTSSTIKLFQRVAIIKCQTRTLQFQFRSVEEKEKFYDEMRMAVKNSRRMHLSYKF